MPAYPKWMYLDPAIVYERKERHANNQMQCELRKIFGDDMGRKLDIPPYVTAAMFQWGEWARRPQFWANLHITPFCKLLGIGGGGRGAPDIRLDPQSMAIHKAVMRQSGQAQMILAGYYVAELNWDARQSLYIGHGISRKAFYDVLRVSSISVCNVASV